jgi:DNA gyrase subunit A
VRDIKTTARNGKVVDIVPVNDYDQILMMTARGKLQRIACMDIKVIGRNTQGVRIMSLDEGDTLAAVVRVPRDELDEEPATAEQSPNPTPTPTDFSPVSPDATKDDSNPTHEIS